MVHSAHKAGEMKNSIVNQREALTTLINKNLKKQMKLEGSEFFFTDIY